MSGTCLLLAFLGHGVVVVSIYNDVGEVFSHYYSGESKKKCFFETPTERISKLTRYSPYRADRYPQSPPTTLQSHKAKLLFPFVYSASLTKKKYTRDAPSSFSHIHHRIRVLVKRHIPSNACAPLRYLGGLVGVARILIQTTKLM